MDLHDVLSTNYMWKKKSEDRDGFTEKVLYYVQKYKVKQNNGNTKRKREQRRKRQGVRGEENELY